MSYNYIENPTRSEVSPACRVFSSLIDFGWHLSYIKLMSSKLEIVRHSPVGFWPMDSASPFPDYSGYSRTATAAGGTPTKAISLSHGVQYSTVFTSAITSSFPTPVFQQGYEDSAFSLSADVRVSGVAGEQKILSNSANYDGLLISGTTISFVIKYLTSGECRVSYDAQFVKRMSVTGVYDVDKILLYIDGELVAQTEVTEAQRADKFTATNSNLYSGGTVSAQSLAINNIAIYPRAIDAREVEDIYNSAHKREYDNVPTMYRGEAFYLGKRDNIIFIEQVFDSEDKWSKGTAMDVKVQGDYLVPTFQADVSLSGYWISNFEIDSFSGTSIFGVNINWDGIGAIVEVSLDGSTWESVYRGKNISLIPPGFNPTDKILLVRVTFPGGITNDQSYMESLTLAGYSTGISTSLNDRTVTYAGAVDIRLNEPVQELSDNFGVRLNGGSVTVGNSTNNPKAVEIWLKRTGTDNAVFSTNLSTSTAFYSNGTVGTAYPEGEWVVRHFVNAAAISGDISISGNVQVGKISLYESVLSATDVANIYASYVGTKINRYSDENAISVTETAGSSKIYAHDWAILASG